MNAKNPIVASIAALLISAASFGEASASPLSKHNRNPEFVVANMIANHDQNNDGIRDSDESPIAGVRVQLVDDEGRIRFVVLDKLGSASVSDTVTLSHIEQAIQNLR